MEIKINYTKFSETDLLEIYEYISGDSFFYADQQLDKIHERVDSLRNHSNLGRKVPEIDLEYIREIIEGNFRIIYMVVDSTRIDILTIHHTSKELKILDFL